jgi:hypothetical protein
MVALAGCGGSERQPALQKHLRRAVAAINGTTDYRALHAKLERTLAAVRAARPDAARDRKAKALTIDGLRWWLRGVDSQIAFVENDSGNLPIATRDALRADWARRRAAPLLRAAGRLLDVRIRTLSGF